MLKRSKSYVHNAQIKLMVNYDQLIATEYGENTLKQVSKNFLRQFNSILPTFAIGKISIDQFEDESAFLNLGQFKEKKYM